MGKASRTTFDYSYGARIAAFIAATLIWALALGALAAGIWLLVLGQPVAAGLVCLFGLLLTPSCLGLQHRMRTVHNWQVSLRPGHVTLVLPANRSVHHKARAFEGEVSYRDIDEIVRRREVYSRLGLQRRKMTYWLALKSGDRLLLGEHRHSGDEETKRTTPVSRAAEAISRTSGLKMSRFEEAEGKPALFGFLVMRPPALP